MDKAAGEEQMMSDSQAAKTVNYWYQKGIVQSPVEIPEEIIQEKVEESPKPTPTIEEAAAEIVNDLQPVLTRELAQLLVDSKGSPGVFQLVKMLEQYLGKMVDLGKIEHDVAVIEVAAGLVMGRIDELKKAMPMRPE